MRTHAGLMVAAGLLGLAVVLAAVFVQAVRQPWLTGDSAVVTKGARAVLDCLSDGRWADCEGASVGTVSQLPLLQYLPALALSAAGLSDDSILRALIVLNAVCLGATLLVLPWTTIRLRRYALWPVLAMVVMCSPLLWYGTAAFGEGLAAFAVALFAAVLVLRTRWPLIALGLVLAGISRETAVPFLLLLGAASFLALEPSATRARRDHLIGILLGSALAIALHAGFNQFRYGSVVNAVYLDAALRVRDLGVWAKAFIGLWMAPNAGLVWFWPSLVLLLGMVTFVAVRQAVRRKAAACPGVLPGLCLTVLLGGLTAGLALWFAPFGWAAWGPRLLLPLAPGVALVAVMSYGAPVEETLRQWTRSAGLTMAGGVVLAALSLPQLAVLWSPAAVSGLFAPDGTCPTTPVIHQDREYYYRCIEHYAWAKRPVLMDATKGLGSWPARGAALAFGVGVVGLLGTARLVAARGSPLTAPRPLDGRRPERLSAG